MRHLIEPSLPRSGTILNAPIAFVLPALPRRYRALSSRGEDRARGSGPHHRGDHRAARQARGRGLEAADGPRVAYLLEESRGLRTSHPHPVGPARRVEGGGDPVALPEAAPHRPVDELRV